MKKVFNRVEGILFDILVNSFTYYVLFFLIMPVIGLTLSYTGLPIVGLIVFIVGIILGFLFHIEFN